MDETKAAFAERTIRSLKNVLYLYKEKYGYKNIHEKTQVVTALISGRNCSIDLVPKNVKSFDVLPILHSKPLREIKKPKFKDEDIVRISKYDLQFRRFIRNSSQRKLLKMMHSLPQNLQHTQ